MANKKYFFGWENLKFIVAELVKMYSNKPSFFSKKRIESGIAFIIAQWGMIFFLVKKYDGLSISDFLFWAGVEFTVSGYILNQIQKEKTNLTPKEEITQINS